MSSEALSNLLHEERTFPPSDEFAADAVAKADLYDEAAKDRLAFWEEQAERLDWATEWGEVLDWQPPFAKWFVGGELNVAVQLRRPARRGRQRRPGRAPLGGRARRHPHHHLRRAQARGLQGRQRPDRARRREGRPGRDLPADDPRGGRRDARLRPDRRAALGRVRRLLGEALQSRIDDASAKLVITSDGGYRRGKPVGAQARRRRGARDVAGQDRRARARRTPHRAGRRRGPTAATCGGTTSSTARAPSTRPQAARHRAPALHPLHVGHDREAEGHPAHLRRLPDPVRLHASPTSSTSSRRPTSTGAPPTSAGSPGTATSSTARWPTARRR